MIIAFWTVFTLPAIVIAIIGGAATGYLVGSVFPPNPNVKRHRVAFAFGVIGFIGIVFFIGQGIEVALGPEPRLWTRLAARALIWIVFTAALAAAGVYAQTRRWR